MRFLRHCGKIFVDSPLIDLMWMVVCLCVRTVIDWKPAQGFTLDPETARIAPACPMTLNGYLGQIMDAWMDGYLESFSSWNALLLPRFSFMADRIKSLSYTSGFVQCPRTICTEAALDPDASTSIPHCMF